MIKEKLKSHKELIVWKKAMDLIYKTYKITGQFPREKMYGLVQQMRRSAVAIPSNIAEGYNRYHIKEYLQFLNIANSSAAELETQLLIAKNLKFIKELDYSEADNSLTEVLKMLTVLIRKLKFYSLTKE